MFFVYVLQSKKDRRFYTGFTNDLNRRIGEHNEGKNFSTKNRLPMKLVYYEWCVSQADAVAREKYLKSGMGKRFLRNRIKYYLTNDADF